MNSSGDGGAPGKFIVIEGADAVGKETQAAMVVQKLREQGRDAKVFPFHRYNTMLGNAIKAHLKRELVFVGNGTKLDLSDATFEDGAPINWKPKEVSAASDLIFQCMAVVDKYDGAAEIAEYVENGGIAVCDRWWQSAYAYGAVDGLPLDWLLRVHQFLPKPHVNFLIELPLEEARRRRPVPEDRYEEDDEKQNAVRLLYRQLWNTVPAAFASGKWPVINGDQSKDAVNRNIMAYLR